MAKKILNYSISIVLCLLITLPLQAQGENRPTPSGEKKDAKKGEKEAEVNYPLYNGISIGVDIFGLGNKVLGGDFLSSEVAVDVNLKNRFFPVVELGYGKTNTSNDYGTTYRTSAPYLRIGMGYNILYKKKFKNCFFVGFRYAMSSFKYDVEASTLSDPIYGGTINNIGQEDGIWGGSLPYDHKGMKGSMSWFELCAGARAHIWKAIYMGWTVRMKYRTGSSTGTFGNPWYVPGYGKYSTNTMGITYTITYKLPY